MLSWCDPCWWFRTARTERCHRKCQRKCSRSWRLSHAGQWPRCWWTEDRAPASTLRIHAEISFRDKFSFLTYSAHRFPADVDICSRSLLRNRRLRCSQLIWNRSRVGESQNVLFALECLWVNKLLSEFRLTRVPRRCLVRRNPRPLFHSLAPAAKLFASQPVANLFSRKWKLSDRHSWSLRLRQTNWNEVENLWEKFFIESTLLRSFRQYSQPVVLLLAKNLNVHSIITFEWT